MSFESRILAFSDRFLSGRAFDLIVAPALADLEFDPGRRSTARLANRVAVMRAVAGGLFHDFSRDAGVFLFLTMVPASYYLCLVAVCFDAFSSWSEVASLVALIVALSLVPAMACLWPARRTARSIE
jgi:hypothetical protein